MSARATGAGRSRRPFTINEIVARLQRHASAENRAGMARYGIATEHAFGVPLSVLRPLSREIEKDHELALALWDHGMRETRLLASFIDIPSQVTETQIDRWVRDFNSWDIVDGVCDLFVRTPFVEPKIAEWCAEEPEFVKRAGFVMIARRAVTDKKAADSIFLPYLTLIKTHATDSRNFVKKAVNWALRQIGKRSAGLHGPALALADQLAADDDPTARWIGRDAAKELRSAKVLMRVQRANGDN